MNTQSTRLVVERVDSLSRRPALVYVTGRLEGAPLRIGDGVVVDDETAPAIRTEIRSVEMHTAPGMVTIALDAELKSIIRSGVVISRSGE